MVKGEKQYERQDGIKVFFHKFMVNDCFLPLPEPSHPSRVVLSCQSISREFYLALLGIL